MKSPEEFFRAIQGANLIWLSNDSTSNVFHATFDGEPVRLTLNDFPDEPIFTLEFRDRRVDIEESPKGWQLS